MINAVQGLIDNRLAHRIDSIQAIGLLLRGLLRRSSCGLVGGIGSSCRFGSILLSHDCILLSGCAYFGVLPYEPHQTLTARSGLDGIHKGQSRCNLNTERL